MADVKIEIISSITSECSKRKSVGQMFQFFFFSSVFFFFMGNTKQANVIRTGYELYMWSVLIRNMDSNVRRSDGVY